MQIGRVSYGYGSSRLWHDPDYTIQRPLYPHPVTRGLDQELPAQAHVAPPAPTDPYIAQEKSYDIAFQQMERGMEGRDFLHGVKSDRAFDKALGGGALGAEATIATAPATAAQAGHATASPQLVQGIEDHIDIADEAIYQAQAVINSQRSGRVESPEEAAVARGIEINRREGLPPPGQVMASQATRTAGYEEARQSGESAREHNRVTEAISMVQGAISTAATAAVGAQAAQAATGTAAQGVVSMNAVMASGASSVGHANQASDAADLDEALRRGRRPSTYGKVLESMHQQSGSTEVSDRPLGPAEGTEQYGLSQERIDELIGSPVNETSTSEASAGDEATLPERTSEPPGGKSGE